MEASKLYPFYMLLCRYYEGQMCNMEYYDFSRLVSGIKQEEAVANEGVSEALEELDAVSAEEFGKFKYAFNRLFVGPGRLVAPPYESSYLNKFGIVMQDETMAVRRSYLAQGLKVQKQNVEPDDHMALELQFILEMIERGNTEAYESFLEKHLLRWVKPHAEKIETGTDDKVCLAMAHLMTATFSIA